MAILFLIMITTLILMKLEKNVYELHETCGIAFLILGLVHIYLNWNWIKANIFGIKKSK